jgi:alkylhydroperoxidase/carboxymuconolactone decarboxylase family protein YurZ/quinol monooxygenase YgiN
MQASMKNIQIRVLIVFMMAISCFSLTLNTKTNMNEDVKLSPTEQSIVTIAALTAKGDLSNLKVGLNDGLDAGLTINQIKEVLVHLYAYCGFPRSLNATNTFMAVLEERKAKGITDVLGREASPSAEDTNKYEQGRKTLEVLTKTPQSRPAKGYGEFAPRIDTFLKEHLFADIFQNDVLSYKQRELATISALATLPGLEPQLTSHISVGKNTGITENELIEISGLIEAHINTTQANVLRKLLSQPIKPVTESDMMVRIAEIEVIPEFLEEYSVILKEEAAASVNIEKGVIAIFPMVKKENPTQIRLVEIYVNHAAYEAHLKTPHFLHYKTSTQHMIKSLKLIDMKSLDTATMPLIFEKLK